MLFFFETIVIFFCQIASVSVIDLKETMPREIVFLLIIF
jgi:hypothetical protein